MGGGEPTKQEPNQYEYELGDIVRQKYDFQKGISYPLTGALMARTKAEKQPWRFERARGEGVSNALAQANPTMQNARRQLASAPGVSPASGAFITREGALRTGTAVASGAAGSDAAFQQGNKYVEGLQKISGIGTRQAQLAQDSMSLAAKQMSSQNQAQAQLNQAENAQDAQMAGTAASAAVTIAVAAIA
jgi:hypothetical protein